MLSPGETAILFMANRSLFTTKVVRDVKVTLRSVILRGAKYLCVQSKRPFAAPSTSLRFAHDATHGNTATITNESEWCVNSIIVVKINNQKDIGVCHERY